MKVLKDNFLQALESVSPGVASKNFIQQSDCFIFKNGEIVTLDEEVSVRVPSNLDPDFTAAIPAKSIREQLRRWKEEEIEVLESAEGLEIKGKGGRRAFFIAEKDIILPIDNLEVPTSWSKLDPDFSDALKIVSACAKANDNNLIVRSVGIHPDFVEASDNSQLARFRVKTGVQELVLVRKSSIKHLPTIDSTEIAETAGWIHFRNPAKVQFSIRKEIPPADYPDWLPYLKKEGEKIILPKSLEDEAQNAALFSAELAEANFIRIDLKPGKMRVRGVGVSGWYEHPLKVEYKGPAMSFMVSPALLTEIVKRHHDAYVSSNKLLVDGGKFRSSIALEPIKKEKKDENQSQENEQAVEEAVGSGAA